MTDSTPTSVYLYYDRNDVLLYVGITSRGIVRNSEHNDSKEWWPYVSRQEIRHYPTRDEATDVERSLIRQWRPPFNKQHNPDYAVKSAAYIEYAPDPGVTDRHMKCDVCNGEIVGAFKVFLDWGEVNRARSINQTWNLLLQRTAEVKALDSLDEALALVRSSGGYGAAADGLASLLDISMENAKAWLDRPISSLTEPARTEALREQVALAECASPQMVAKWQVGHLECSGEPVFTITELMTPSQLARITERFARLEWAENTDWLSFGPRITKGGN